MTRDTSQPLQPTITHRAAVEQGVNVGTQQQSVVDPVLAVVGHWLRLRDSVACREPDAVAVIVRDAARLLTVPHDGTAVAIRLNVARQTQSGAATSILAEVLADRTPVP